LLVPLTEAVNCWLCPEAKLTIPGVTPTLMGGGGVRVMVADPVLVVSALLVAVRVTV
jgi:hypothetical protein